jgi:hypothetical protein
MTVLWEGLRKTVRFGGPKTRKVKKVTTSQDDGLVGGLKIIPVGRANKKYQKRHTLSG